MIVLLLAAAAVAGYGVGRLHQWLRDARLAMGANRSTTKRK